MMNSLDPGSLYQQLMTLYKVALARYGGPKLQAAASPQDTHEVFKSDIFKADDFKGDDKLSRLAQVFTAAVNIGELADDTSDTGAAECLTLAEIALMSEILTQIGPLGHLPQDFTESMVALLDDFETKAPALAIRLRNGLTGTQREKSA